MVCQKQKTEPLADALRHTMHTDIVTPTAHTDTAQDAHELLADVSDTMWDMEPVAGPGQPWHGGDRAKVHAHLVSVGVYQCLAVAHAFAVVVVHDVKIPLWVC